MDGLSLADVFWSALLLAGATTQVLDARSRRRERRHKGGRDDVAERELTLA